MAGPGLEWTASTTASWLTVSGDASGTQLGFAADGQAAQPGSTTSVVTLTTQVNGDTVTQPVTVNLNADQRRALPTDWRVAFNSLPDNTDLVRTLTVRDNFGPSEFGGLVGFTISADVPWISVSPGFGRFLGAIPITITADPSNLPNGSLSLGTVTVTPVLSFMEPARIRVSLWKDGASPPALSDPSYVAVATDWLRPYTYAHRGGGSIDIVNRHTQQVVGQIGNLPETLVQMDVSRDDSLLFVLDPVQRNLVVIDLDRRVPVTTWPLGPLGTVDRFTQVATGRPNGVDVVFLGNGRAYSGGRDLGDTGIPPGSPLVMPDGTLLQVHPTGGTGPLNFDIDFSAMSGGVLMVRPR